MTYSILDGTGGGTSAKVDKDNRLHTYSVSESTEQALAQQGRSFNFNTGNISLTTANESAVAYFKNNGDNDVHVTSIGYLLGNSTGGSGDLEAHVLRNPTTGTIVSNAADVPVLVNKNFGSTNQLTANAYKGAEGNTLTDGSDAYYSLIPGAARAYIINTGDLVIPKGQSIGVTITPQSSNTSMNVQVFMALLDDTLGDE